MTIKATKPVIRESTAIVATEKGERPLVATLFEDELWLRPKRTQQERKVKLRAIYAANIGSGGEDEGLKETAAEVRTPKGMRTLLVAVRGATLVIRPKGTTDTEMLDIASAYFLAVRQRVSRDAPKTKGNRR